MEKRNNFYTADKGKWFVLTALGEKECASYKGKVVGEPVSEYYDEAVEWAVLKKYLIEVPIPDWTTMEGYEVVYDHKGYTLHAGNPFVFPVKEAAETYMENYAKYPWCDHSLYIRPSVWEGRQLVPCREFEGNKVINKSYYFGIMSLKKGSLVEENIVNDLMNCVPPAKMSSSCFQVGKAFDHAEDPRTNKVRARYSTFQRIAENIWKYCGECFYGETVPLEERSI